MHCACPHEESTGTAIEAGCPSSLGLQALSLPVPARPRRCSCPTSYGYESAGTCLLYRLNGTATVDERGPNVPWISGFKYAADNTLA